ncbi:hydrogen peroxide-dependent heme synthase [Naasia sp. SYSU D00948]|uniref:hydrogen peroxide-dependent heme synthase n=1 Tax=Naasia sp. SYSU D00948 TaxID=2817379 RepID=UPI001B3132A0|nr:hydrogen peroxide-dependent heme synthase [Naasia sp. SYSU D00948]
MESMTSTAYALWAVFRRNPSHPAPAGAAEEIENLVAELSAEGITVRGFYDVSSLRADADVMVWIVGSAAEDLQMALRQLRRTALLSTLLPTWNALGVHREAEFSASHVPGFLRGERARNWLTVYPFVRSYDWYVLPEDERKRMLAEHGRKGAAYKSVVANTVAAFALGDYEWILPMESDILVDLVDMMRDLRATDARMHVREEVPFFTGRLIAPSELPEVLS